MSFSDLSESESSLLDIQKTQEPLNNAINHDLLVESLKKPKKTTEDCERIYEAVRELEFFKSMFASYQTENNLDVLMGLCANMRYESVRAGGLVFKQGDESNSKFYVILSGQVGVIVSKKLDMLVRPAASKATLSTISNLAAMTKIENKPEAETDKLEVENRKTEASGKKVEFQSIEEESQNKKAEAENKKGGLPFRLIEGLEKEADTQNKKPDDATNRASTGRRSTLRFGDNFGSAVAMAMAAKRVVQKARLLLKNRSSGPSMVSLDDDCNDEQEFKEKAEQHGKIVRLLNPGNEFGDVVFKKANSRRTATIMCKKNSEFIVIDANFYGNIITALREKKNNFLLQAFSFLSEINASQLQHRIFYSFFVISLVFPHG